MFYDDENEIKRICDNCSVLIMNYTPYSVLSTEIKDDSSYLDGDSTREYILKIKVRHDKETK